MADNLLIVPIPQNTWVDLYDATGIAVGSVLQIENSGAADVYLSVQEAEPAKDDKKYNVIKRPPSVNMQNSDGDLGAWAYCSNTNGQLSISSPAKNGFLPTISSNTHDGFGNPINSLKGAIDVHDADVHNVPVNELFHRHSGIITTLAAATVGGVTQSIDVVDGSAFANGDPIQIESTTFIEPTYPIIISGGGTNTFVLDRPIDGTFAIGDSVEQVTTNLAVDGSVTPVAFKLQADIDQIWHIVRFLLAMVHDSAADDGRFGNIAGGLINGCILRGFNGATGQYRTFTNWKTNGDIKMDMFDVNYTDKAGAGDFGTNGRGSIKDGTGSVPRIDHNTDDFLELLIQDNLLSLIRFNLKGQGHIEGL